MALDPGTATPSVEGVGFTYKRKVEEVIHKGEWIVIDFCPTSGKGVLDLERDALAVALSGVWQSCGELSYGANLTQGSIALVGGIAGKGISLELTPCVRYFKWPSRWHGGQLAHKKILVSRKLPMLQTIKMQPCIITFDTPAE